MEGVIEVIYVGIFSIGKRPLYAIQLIESLYSKGINIRLSLYGNGKEKENLQNYIDQNTLNDFIFIKGNQPQEVIKKAYQESHFVILPSESEGWPKVIAEGMFWGCLPIATKVSCVPNMLDNGNRGLLLDLNLEKDTQAMVTILNQPERYRNKVQQAILWSRKYTLDAFEDEIKTLLHS